MNKMRFSVMMLSLLVGLSAFSADITKMRVNDLDIPFGIDQTPRFSWVTVSQERGGSQSAYEIEVTDGQGEQVWLSGRRASANSCQIAYEGPSLKSKSVYRWRVRIWDQNGQCSAWSESQTFETAMLSDTDWKAQWIKADQRDATPKATVGFDSPVVARYVRIDAQKLGLVVRSETNQYRLQLSEIEVLDTTGSNVALGKNAVISPEESYLTWWRAENLTDGRINDTQYLGATTSAQGSQTPSSLCYAEIDLGEERAISGVVIYPRFDTPAASDASKCANFPQDFTISVKSDDGEAYDVVYRATNFPTPEFLTPVNMMAFGKSVVVDKPVVKARMYASGAGVFELRINGKQVTSHVLEPGESYFPKSVFYATYDVTPLLKEGRNILLAYVSGAQYHNPSMERYQKLTNDFGPLRFIGQLEVEYADGTTETFASDDSWRYMLDIPYSFCSWYGGEDYDANHFLCGDIQEETMDAWPKAVVCTEPIGKLTAQFYQPTEVVETWHPTEVKALGGGNYLVDFGQNFAGQYDFTLQGNKGQTIQLWPAELLDGNGGIKQDEIGTPVYDQYTFSGKAEGETWGPAFVYHGFRYLLVKGLSEMPDASQFTAKRIRLGVEQTGTFSCSNSLVNDIHTLIVRSIASNMYNSLTDCPHREKLGWLEVPQLLYNSLVDNFDLAAWMPKVALDTRDSQHDDGYVCNVAPGFYELNEFWGNDPSWGGSTILVPYRSYLTYGDRRTLEEQYPAMKKLMTYYLSRRSGNLIDINTLGDWGSYDNRTSVKFTINCTYYALAKSMAEVATIVGYPEDVEYYTDLANLVRESLNKEYYHEEGYYDTNTQATNSMALYYGIVEEKNKQKVLESLVQCVKDANYHLTTGEVALKPLFMSLAENGYNDIVYKMVTAEDMPSYGYFVRQNATSLPEFWDMRGSQNHCMMGHVDEWFYSQLCGIQNMGVAYDSIMIAPYFAPELSWANSHVKTIRGEVAVEWSRSEGDAIQLRVEIPFGTRAWVVVPNEYAITENGRDIAEADGVLGMTADADTLRIEIGSGSYDLQLRGLANGISGIPQEGGFVPNDKWIYNVNGQVVGSDGCVPSTNGIYISGGRKWAVH